MSPNRIKVILGSSRANRFSEKPTQWIFEAAKKRADLEVELLDLRDYPLPFFQGMRGQLSETARRGLISDLP